MSTNRHVTLAYLLLLVTLGLLLKILALPAVANLSSQHKANRALQNEVLALQVQRQKAEQNNAAVRLEIKSMLESDVLVYAAKASDAGHRLQELLKSVLQRHSVTISQLRPTNEALAGGLSKSRLELSFQVSAESLQGLLVSLSESRSKLHIELISLRSNEKYLTSAQTSRQTNILNNLEVNLAVAMWYTNDISFANTDALALSTDSASAIKASKSPQPNILAGLFDQNARSRFRSPSLKHYRLAAINIFQSSRIAIIANTSDGNIRRLEPGDMLDAWRVESIDSSGVSLKIGDRQETLNLSP
ncbi:MAG: hypothetical protein JKX81_11945 [Arenicella sp.]|nr:hypothetical protein [Arenicella sp.]